MLINSQRRIRAASPLTTDEINGMYLSVMSSKTSVLSLDTRPISIVLLYSTFRDPELFTDTASTG